MDRLPKQIRNTLVALLASLVMLMPSISQAQDYASSIDETPSALAMTGDMVIVRPAMLAITAVTTVVWVVALPFSALGGNVGESFDVMVKGPAVTTFRRCLGCTALDRRPDDRM